MRTETIRAAGRWPALCLSLSLCLTPLAHAQEPGTDIVMGQSHSLYSEVLGEARTVLVSKPIGYDQADESYPVLIALDGYNHFFHTTSMGWFLQANQLIPGLLVVSIENTVRARDLTPPSEAPFDLENFPELGGAAAFQAFIADELIPWLDANYRTRPYRILVGHSHGGLFAIYSLTTRPELFQGLHRDQPEPAMGRAAFRRPRCRGAR